MEEENKNFILKDKSNKYKNRTSWADEVGVVKVKNGKYIVRMRKGENNRATTISQHKSKKEALDRYEELNT